MPNGKGGIIDDLISIKLMMNPIFSCERFKHKKRLIGQPHNDFGVEMEDVSIITVF